MSTESYNFWLAAAGQRVCAKCGKAKGYWDAHHVVEKQALKKLGMEHLVWDPRNARRLCEDCHGGQTSKLRKVRLKDLTDDNIAFAFEALGDFAFDYLQRNYRGEDPRVQAAFDANHDFELGDEEDGGIT